MEIFAIIVGLFAAGVLAIMGVLDLTSDPDEWIH